MWLSYTSTLRVMVVVSVRDSHAAFLLAAVTVSKCVWTTSCMWRITSSSRAQGDALTFQAEDRLGCLCRSTVRSKKVTVRATKEVGES